MQKTHVRPVENYTTAFAVSMFVLAFSCLIVGWALFGYVPTVLLATALYACLPAPRHRR